MRKIPPLLITIFIFLLAACSSGRSAEDDLALTQTFESAVGTAIVETIAAALPDDSTGESSDQPTGGGEQVTPEQQPTQEASATPQAQITQASTQSAIIFTPTATDLPEPCYRAELVDETIPDGTVFPPGQGFVKVWNVQNTGVCEWTEDFRWVLTDGIDFRGPRDIRFGRSVMPGEVMKVALELGAPTEPGTFTGTYKIFTDENTLVTPNGFWISIVVEEDADN
ncbi:MAG: NBR1-Ig-like domain-containing protein [Anaerolineales bacterium]|jgi:hypothetical protein